MGSFLINCISLMLFPGVEQHLSTSLFPFGSLFCLFMRLLSQFLLKYLGSSFTSLSLRLSTFHTHYRVPLATLCSIQNLSLSVCPSWSTFLDFVSRISLVPDLRQDNISLTDREAVHRSALFAFLSTLSSLHRHLLQVLLPDQSPMVRIDCQ